MAGEENGFKTHLFTLEVGYLGYRPHSLYCFVALGLPKSPEHRIRSEASKTPFALRMSFFFAEACWLGRVKVLSTESSASRFVFLPLFVFSFPFHTAAWDPRQLILFPGIHTPPPHSSISPTVRHTPCVFQFSRVSFWDKPSRPGWFCFPLMLHSARPAKIASASDQIRGIKDRPLLFVCPFSSQRHAGLGESRCSLLNPAHVVLLFFPCLFSHFRITPPLETQDKSFRFQAYTQHLLALRISPTDRRTPCVLKFSRVSFWDKPLWPSWFCCFILRYVDSTVRVQVVDWWISLSNRLLGD